MSNHARDYDKIMALLKSIAAPCQSDRKNAEHSWRNCRHCLAIAELEQDDVRAKLQVFLLAVEIGDRHYGKTGA
jgi:hypothetical protein